MGNLFNYQYDFIKVKTQKINRESVNWEMLNEHPTIKNAYTLDAKSGLYGKNFKLYFTKGDCVILETSVPYLLHGHNYVEITSIDLRMVIETLEKLLRIELYKAQVLQFEYGGYCSIDTDAKDYIKSLVGIDGFELKYNTAFMKMYGNNNINFKIYDAVTNAKAKKTFKLGEYPKQGLIKYEIKYNNVKRSFNTGLELLCLFFSEIEESHKEGLNVLVSCIKKIELFDYSKLDISSLKDILFMTLINVERQFKCSIHENIIKIIDMSGLSPSQKSKRRKSLADLENKYRLTQLN